MEDKDKTKEELLSELAGLRQMVSELKAEEAEHKRVEEAISQMQEANYRAIFNAANDAIFVHDMETGQILDVNEKACEMFCYPKDELLKLDVGAISSGEAPYNQENAVRLVNKSAQGESQLFEWHCKDKAGRLFWVEVNLKRAVIGTKYRILAVVRDITERKITEEALMQRNYQLEILSRTSQHINTVLEVPVILRTLIGAAMELVSATGGTAGLLEDKKMIFNEYNKEGKIEPIHVTCEPGRSICWCVSEVSKPYISNDVEHDENINPEVRKTFNIYNLICIPIVCKDGKTLGCFQLHNKSDRKPFDTQDAFMLQGLVASAAVALENARLLEEHKKSGKRLRDLYGELLKSHKKLEKVALLDVHTGLYNYRYLGKFIEVEFYRSRRDAHPFSATMIDIDYFKSINDVYGHRFGDLVLKQFADRLKRMVRPYDVVIRYGGEEFIIISPGTDREGVMTLAQRLLKAISLSNFGDKKHAIKLKLSIGVSSYPKDKVNRGMDLVEISDRAMSMAKEKGGNTVCSSLDLKKKYLPDIKKATEENPEIRMLKVKINNLNKRGHQGIVEAVTAFARTIEAKDHVTGKHIERAVYYATEIAKRLDLSEEEIEHIKQAAILHDLGKVGISDRILRKKGNLTKREFEEIKDHPQIGVDIIRPIHTMHPLIPLLLYHHEQWDGKGYPAGLKGEEIPMGARIIAIADVYEALTSKRSYRKAYSKEEAINIIKNGIGTQFDPTIVGIFLEILKTNHKKR